jgi:tripartite-type tricarboxylate transporter receptor subunit TctC
MMKLENSKTNFLKKTLMLALLVSGVALAQTYPDKNIKIMQGFAPGGNADAIARAVGSEISKSVGQAVVVEAQAGAGGTIAATTVAKSKPDGYTLLLATGGHAVAGAIYNNLNYKTVQDFEMVSTITYFPFLVVINAENKIANFPALLNQAKANPGKIAYGTAGIGSTHHLAGELFKLQTQTFITHIPYRGAGPALQDLIAGNVDMMFDGLGSSAAHIKGGRIKALMVAGAKRNPAFPDVPCAAELGLPDYTVSTWYGMWAPKGTPAEAQAGFIDWSQKIANSPEIKTAWANNGAEYPNVSGAQFGAFIAAEIKRWAVVVKASGAKLD